jgi:hypothetical protein
MQAGNLTSSFIKSPLKAEHWEKHCGPLCVTIFATLASITRMERPLPKPLRIYQISKNAIYPNFLPQKIDVLKHIAIV